MTNWDPEEDTLLTRGHSKAQGPHSFVRATKLSRVNRRRAIPNRERRVALRVLTREETLASPLRTLGCETAVPAAHSSVVEENQVKTCPFVRDRKVERD